jgi:hypothetical protein
MNAKHTPGPWHVMCISDEIKSEEELKQAHRRDCHCGYVFDSENCEKVIAKVLHNDPRLPNFEPMEGELPLEEKNANARLIAAAPEMYEALCDMVSDHEALSQATLDFARKVLAKARGEVIS